MDGLVLPSITPNNRLMVKAPLKSRQAQYNNRDAVAAKKTLKVSLKLSQSFPGAEEATKTLVNYEGWTRTNKRRAWLCTSKCLVISIH